MTSIFPQFLALFEHTSAFSADLLVIVAVFFLFFFYALLFGKGRLVSLIIAFYPAAFAFEHFPFLNNLIVLHGAQLIVVNKAIIFILFLVLCNILVSRYMFMESEGSSFQFLRTAIYALAAVALCLVFSHALVPTESVYHLSPTFENLFSTPTKLFWWIIGPLIVLTIF